jgi:hypothetical protein
LYGRPTRHSWPSRSWASTGPAQKQPLAGSSRFRLGGGFICCRRRLSLVPRAPARTRSCLLAFFRSRLCGYTPGERIVTGTGGRPPTRSRGGDRFLAASGAGSWPSCLGLVTLPVGSFGELGAGSSSSSSQSPWEVRIGRVTRGGSPTALGVLLSLRMLTVRTENFRSAPCVPIWFLGSVIPCNLYLGLRSVFNLFDLGVFFLILVERRFSGALIVDSSFRSE